MPNKVWDINVFTLRINENSANRKNGARLFDSQNNDKGGYNTGDVTATAAGTDPKKYYSMVKFDCLRGQFWYFWILCYDLWWGK